MSEISSSEAGMLTPPLDSDSEASTTSTLLDCLATTKDVFDERGDLQLLVGADGALDQALYTVCSRALSRTSPVFNAMLRRSTADGDDWIVKLPEDDAQSIRVILSIAHGRFRDVPASMTLERLHQLCICLHKYDIAECLGPWAEAWCQSARSRVEDSFGGPGPLSVRVDNQATVEDNVRTAWVAYVLGNKRLLEETTEYLLWYSSPSSLTAEAGREHLVPLDSTGILDEMKTVQIKTTKSLASMLHKAWSDNVRGPPCVSGCAAPRSDSADKKACAAAIVGSLTTSLCDKHLFVQKDISYEDFSVDKFARIARDVAREVVVPPSRSKGVFQVDHSSCTPSEKMLLDIEKATKGLGPVLATAHYLHLEKRAKRIGVEY